MSTATTGEQRPPPTAAEVCRDCQLSEQAVGLLTEGLPPAEFLNALVQAERYDDAGQFLAYWLPKPEAIWWGCLAGWSAYRDRPTPAADEALQAAVSWLREPTERNRRIAQAAGEVLGLGDPAGAVALAVFFSGGSISLPGLPEVPAPAGLTAKAVYCALVTAAARGDPAQREDRQRTFLRLGVGIATGQLPWK